MGIKVSDLPDKASMVRNIVGAYYCAEPIDVENGTYWYQRTRVFCQEIADTYGYPLANVVGAYAVLSPSSKKERNDSDIWLAAMFHKAGWAVENAPKMGTYGMPNRRKAWRCLDGDLSAVGGRKVTSFFRNIMGYSYSDVTVDRWALRVCLNDPGMPDALAVPSSRAAYEAVKAAYTDAAERLHTTPMECQSRTWESFRRSYYLESQDAYK